MNTPNEVNKHASGPWFVVRHNSPMKWTIQTKQDGAGECIAQQYEDSSIDNARLIAAAPELLRALKFCLECEFAVTDKEGIDQANAAIAKAEGR